MAERPAATEGVVQNRAQGRAAMAYKQLPILVFLTCLLPGCATVGPIETSGDAASLPPFKTFHIHEEQFVFATEITNEQRERISKELRNAAVSALNSRGYKE